MSRAYSFFVSILDEIDYKTLPLPRCHSTPNLPRDFSDPRRPRGMIEAGFGAASAPVAHVTPRAVSIWAFMAKLGGLLPSRATLT